LEDKKYVSHEAFGNTHRYYPLISREAYRRQFVNASIADFYDNSYKNMVSFFAREEKISVEELKEIIALIENSK
jgi:predicted transcriptional regulator